MNNIKTIYNFYDDIEEKTDGLDNLKEFDTGDILTLNDYIIRIVKKWIIEDDEDGHYEYSCYGFYIADSPIDGPYYELEKCIEELSKELYRIEED